MAPQPNISNLPPKILVIVGPTSSGKSELGVKLAKKFKGEIVSCDSRQIYRRLNIGTGKVEGSWKKLPLLQGRAKTTRQYFTYKNIIHHCIDYISPERQYTVAEFKRDARKVISDVLERGHVPILCGGTGHWIDAVVFDQQLPEVKPHPELRKKLESLSAEMLYERLQRLDPARAGTIDPHNPRRLIRALEIVITTGKPVPHSSLLNFKSKIYFPLWLGINLPQEQLYKKIDKRLKQRLKQGMVREIQKLRKQGVSWKRLESFGLEYKFVSLHLQKKLTYEEMFTQLSYAIKHYSKRQMTWFKRNHDISWIKSSEEAQKIVNTFLGAKSR